MQISPPVAFAGPAVIASLRHDPTPRVVAALLENPRLTEGLLMPLAAGEKSAPQVLALLASSPRWSGRQALRYALCRNPATPIPSALAMLPMLGKRELEAVAHVAARYGKPSQVSVERVMGCGMGGCYSCVIPVKDAGGGQHYVRSCIGGPVFKGADLVWD